MLCSTMRRIFRPCFKILFQRNFSRLCSVVSFSESLLTCCMFQDVSYSQFICVMCFRMRPTASLFVSRVSGCVLQPIYLLHVFQDVSYSQFICLMCFRMCPTASFWCRQGVAFWRKSPRTTASSSVQSLRTLRPTLTSQVGAYMSVSKRSRFNMQHFALVAFRFAWHVIENVWHFDLRASF